MVYARLVIDDELCGPEDEPRRLEALPRGVAERRGLLVYKLANELLARMGPHFRDLGIDGRDYYLLAVLSNDAPGSQAELARLCSLLPAQLVPVLDALESAGLVERRRDERDRRRMIVRITEDGRARLAQVDEAARGLEAELLGPVDDELRGRLADGFRTALGAPAPAA